MDVVEVCDFGSLEESETFEVVLDIKDESSPFVVVFFREGDSEGVTSLELVVIDLVRDGEFSDVFLSLDVKIDMDIEVFSLNWFELEVNLGWI